MESPFKKDLYLKVAGFGIHVSNASALPMLLEEGYDPFVVGQMDSDMTAKAYAGIPESLQAVTPIYSAQQEGNVLWNIARSGDGYRITVFDQESPALVNQVATVSKDFRHWDIHCRVLEQDGEQGICPLLYPMGPLLMYYLTVINNAIMIHASGVYDGEKGRIFSGVSGVGKSTMAGIWKSQGATVINDDRLIIRKEASGYSIHNTPMFYADEPKHAPLGAIYLPRHAKENSVEPLSGAMAISRLMAFCIQHGYDRDIIAHHMDVLSELCGAVPVHTLGVVPTVEVIDFIKMYEQG